MNAARPRTFALIAAGGTGGHVYPAIAVAQALVADGHPRAAIRFVTESREMSTAAIGGAGFDFDVVALRHGLQRRLAVANVTVVLQAIRSLAQSFALLRQRRPQVIIGFGAYVSLPLMVAARIKRVPVVVHEQNAYPGLANRIAVRLGAHAAASLTGTALRGAVITGNPVRPSVVEVHRLPQQPPLVAFVGGSLGARVLDDAALGLYDLWRHRTDLAVRHVSGLRSFAACERALTATRSDGDELDYQLVEYEHDMAALYSRASVMVTRAGGSVAELAAAGMPAVLVPWSGAAEHHQHANAEVLRAAGAAVVVEESLCTAGTLAEVLDSVIAVPGRLASMSAAARALAVPDAAQRVARLAAAVARP